MVQPHRMNIKKTTPLKTIVKLVKTKVEEKIWEATLHSVSFTFHSIVSVLFEQKLWKPETV